MDLIRFSPLIDVPLVVLTVAGFLRHFHKWAKTSDVAAEVDLATRLPKARSRVVVLFATLLLVCWFANVAVWLFYALLLGAGLVVLAVTGGDAMGGDFGLLLVGYVIREWCFDFPQIVLQPPKPGEAPAPEPAARGDLTGKQGVTVCPCSPFGEARIDGVKVAVSSFDGRLIDAGARVAVNAYRNGQPCVSLIPENPPE
jgi:hypothetical protein